MRDIGRPGELVPQRHPPARIKLQDHVFIESDPTSVWCSYDELDVVAAKPLPVVRNGHIELE